VTTGPPGVTTGPPGVTTAPPGGTTPAAGTTPGCYKYLLPCAFFTMQVICVLETKYHLIVGLWLKSQYPVILNLLSLALLCSGN
jgi:hypothetical protein